MLCTSAANNAKQEGNNGKYQQDVNNVAGMPGERAKCPENNKDNSDEIQ
jgi:hypothetical protein